MNLIDSPFVDVRVRWQPVHRCSSHAIGHWLPAILFLSLLSLALTACGSADRSQGYSDPPPSNRTAYVAWQTETMLAIHRHFAAPAVQPKPSAAAAPATPRKQLPGKPSG